MPSRRPGTPLQIQLSVGMLGFRPLYYGGFWLRIVFGTFAPFICLFSGPDLIVVILFLPITILGFPALPNSKVPGDD